MVSVLAFQAEGTGSSPVYRFQPHKAWIDRIWRAGWGPALVSLQNCNGSPIRFRKAQVSWATNAGVRSENQQS